MSKYLAGLEGVRGLGCLAIITAHAWTLFAPESTPPGAAQLLGIGLVIFFAMSGLLIYLPFVRDIAAGERRLRVGRYAKRRLLRVFPAYLVIFLVCSFVLQAVYLENAVDTARPGSDVGTGMMTDASDLLLNLTLLHTFFPETIQTGINPSWSLTTEFCFYAALPLLSLPLVRWSRGRVRAGFWLALAPPALLLVVGWAARAWAEHLYAGRPDLDTFSAEYGANGIAVLSRSFLAIADNFAWGMVVAVLLVWMERGHLAALTRRRVTVVCTGLILFGGAVGVAVHDSHPWFNTAAISLSAGALLLMMVEPSARGTSSLLVRLFDTRLLEEVGQASLSVYLWHYPLLILLARSGLVDRAGGDTWLTMLWVPVVAAAGAVLLGMLTYRLVERPAMEWGSRRPTSRVPVAIAHDYLTQRGGAERVVLAMHRAFPDAPIYTTLWDPPETFGEYADLDVRTSWLNRIGPLRRRHRLALPLLPLAASMTRIDADVVLCSSSGWAHGFRTPGRKVVYCYTPARWLHQTQKYLGDHPSRGTALALRVLHPLLRRWDDRAARGATEYVAISSVVQDRILTTYGIGSTVVPAPWPDTASHPSEPMPEVEAWLGGASYELCVSRLLPYKNVRAVVQAYADEPDRRLIVVGRGPEETALQALAGDNVLFLQNISDGELAWLYRGTTALLALSYEDFGLTPLEAASFGKPSIVLRWGGFVETMVEDLTAVFVDLPTPERLRVALRILDTQQWDADRIRAHADRFGEAVFAESIREIVKRHAGE